MRSRFGNSGEQGRRQRQSAAAGPTSGAATAAASRRRDRGTTTTDAFTPIDSRSRRNHRDTEGTEPHRGSLDPSHEYSEINSCEVMISLCGSSVFSVPLWFNGVGGNPKRHDDGLASAALTECRTERAQRERDLGERDLRNSKSTAVHFTEFLMSPTFSREAFKRSIRSRQR